MRLRTSLDEATASFWDDNTCYRALSDGQREVANYLLTMYKARKTVNADEEIPEGLRALALQVTDSVTSGQDSDTLPTDFWYDLSVRYNHDNVGSSFPCFRRDLGRNLYHKQVNTYLTADTSREYYYSITATEIQFETSATATAPYSMWYLRKVTEIDGSTNPILPDMTIEAILKYAFAELLLKDQRISEAAQILQNFTILLQGIY